MKTNINPNININTNTNTSNKCVTNTNKIVVFDLDETLGYFSQFGIFWNTLKRYIHSKPLLSEKVKIDQTLFNKTLDLYPEYLRPNIINILAYLKKQKMKNHCSQLMIYTNNQGPNEWASYLQEYFETKLGGYKLFNQLIRAFKVGNERVEICRTSHNKSHEDLIRCTKIPETTQICFLDDVFHPEMENPNVYYINVKPYIHDLPISEIISRFIKNISNINEHFINVYPIEKIQQTLTSYISQYKDDVIRLPKSVQNVDKIISKRILDHLHTFFRKQIQDKQTQDKQKQQLNKTIKKTQQKAHNKTNKKPK